MQEENTVACFYNSDSPTRGLEQIMDKATYGTYTHIHPPIQQLLLAYTTTSSMLCFFRPTQIWSSPSSLYSDPASVRR